MKRIVFQGDSITDCGRVRAEFDSLGNGYPYLVKGALGADFPNEYEVLNRGVSGNRIVDLYARIKADMINLAPDYLSLYVGVNDTWHEICSQNGVDTEKFEKIYTMLLDEVIAACPQTKIILIAPYVLLGSATSNTEKRPNKWERFRKDVAEKAEVCKKLADRYGLTLIELQPAFDKANEKAPSEFWTADGVHPTVCGHELIKRLWLEAFQKLI